MEVRLYAEDPERNFLPGSGRLDSLRLPKPSAHLRLDGGVVEGDVVTIFYDPMIAKLIVWDESRERARTRLLQALAQYRVVGVANNVEFLSRLAACPAFAEGDLDTGLIERERGFLFPGDASPPAEAYLLASLAELLREAQDARRGTPSDPDPHSPWRLRDGGG